MNDPQREYAAILERLNAIYAAHPHELLSTDELIEVSRLNDRAYELQLQVARRERMKGAA